MATVYIAHASIDENGNSTGGTAGDQTGKEVCKRTWYNNSWDFMAVYPDGDVREDIASAAEDGAANDNIGYDKGDRNSLNTKAKAVGYKLSKITAACECDCSSFVNTCVVAAGVGSYGSNGWTTSTLKTQLKNLGFAIVTSSAYLSSSAYCVRGAIYVRSGYHTVIGLTNGASYAKTLSKAGVSSGSITVDGSWGTDTTSKAQTVFGTTVDGYVSGQLTSCKKYLTAASTTSWKFSASGSGSQLIKAVQKKVGATQDGKAGQATVKALQTWLNSNASAGLTVDGYMGAKTVKAFQTWLNKQ